MAVVEDVWPTDDGAFVVRVSEINWDGQDGVTASGVPFRDIRLEADAEGRLQLPPGVGFAELSEAPPLAEGGADEDGLPALGETPVPEDLALVMDGVEVTKGDDYEMCMGYIYDISDTFQSYIRGLATSQSDNYLDARELPIHDAVPRVGSLLVWDTTPPSEETEAARVGSSEVGWSSSDEGHAAFVEDVRENYDEEGTLVSYTITISESNGQNNENIEEPDARAFTVGVGPGGAALLPDRVGFHHPPSWVSADSGPASPSPAGAPDDPISRAQTYVVQEGDTLTSIATRAGIYVQDLVAFNGLDDPDTLAVGQELEIP